MNLHVLREAHLGERAARPGYGLLPSPSFMGSPPGRAEAKPLPTNLGGQDHWEAAHGLLGGGQCPPCSVLPGLRAHPAHPPSSRGIKPQRGLISLVMARAFCVRSWLCNHLVSAGKDTPNLRPPAVCLLDITLSFLGPEGPEAT